MPDCNKTLTYRTYRRVGPVQRVGGVQKTPAQAPAHTKTDAQILAELSQKLEDEIAARNAEPTPQCHPCDLAGETVSTVHNFREFHLIWTETYELRDAQNNVIRGTAKYMARAQADVETRIVEKTCDEPFGDDPVDFGYVDPEKPNLAVVTYNLKDLWNALPKEQRRDMKFTDGKKG
jgi:hypothetical protein